MKTLKKITALALCLITVFSIMSITVSAASVSASLGYNEAENSGDYAYWNGSKVVKSSSTTKDEIKWMQAALNYCISKEGLSATKLTIDGSFGPASKNATIAFQKATGLSADGSFGPATIKKMKSVLNDGKATFKKNTTSTTTKNTVTENHSTTGNPVVYTYVTVTVDTSSLNNWVNSMKKANDTACKNGAIVAAKVTKNKTVTWSIPKATVYQGAGITGNINVKYNVPATIQYKVHTHKRETGFGNNWWFDGTKITSFYKCNCGYVKQLTSWEIPWFDPTGGTQSTKTIIQGLPQF